jgi:hypothetical protein
MASASRTLKLNCGKVSANKVVKAGSRLRPESQRERGEVGDREGGGVAARVDHGCSCRRSGMCTHGAEARAFVACAANHGRSSSVFMGACRRRVAALGGRACPPAGCGRGVRRSNDGDDWSVGPAGSMCACPPLLSCHALLSLSCLHTAQHLTLSEATTWCAVLWGRHDKRTKKGKRYIGDYSLERAWRASSLVLLSEESPVARSYTEFVQALGGRSGRASRKRRPSHRSSGAGNSDGPRLVVASAPRRVPTHDCEMCLRRSSPERRR